MDLTPKELESLRHLKVRLQRELGDDLSRILLYGSAARGERHAESDIDVLVFVKGVRQKVWRKVSHISVDVYMEDGVQISAHTIDEDHFAWLKSIERLFALEVERDGIPI